MTSFHISERTEFKWIMRNRESDMAFVIVPEFNVKQDKVEKFKDLIAQHAHNSVNNETECLAFDSCQDPDDPTRFILYEVYVKESSLETHRQSDHYRWFSEMAESLVHPGPDGKLPQSVQRFHRTACGAVG